MNSNLSLDEVNALSPEEFQEKFINVVECWPNAAIHVSALSPFSNANAFLNSFSLYLDQLNQSTKIEILNSHPDLVGKLSDNNALTNESKFEQHCAGLDRLQTNMKKELFELIGSYKLKFGFPFVICVRANDLQMIIQILKERLQSTYEDEIKNGIEEVKKICNLRIRQIVNI